MTGKQFLYIVIATFITIIIWVIMDIVHTRYQSQPPAEINQLLEPIDPYFDLEAVNDL